MTSRGKSAVRGVETEIERSREESNWKKAVELALQLKSRSPQHESLANFLIGEGKLEAYLEEWPPLKEYAETAARELSEARGYLGLATDEAGRRAGVALDAHLLLGKLHYASGDYDEALRHYTLAELNTLTEKELPVRSLRIVAESFAIKGLCLEAGAAGAAAVASRYKQAERDTEMIRSYEVSAELALLYLQRVTGGARAGLVLETALQRAPALLLRARRVHDALDRYRELLRAQEAPGAHALRLALARQLAELLLRPLAPQTYRPPAAERPGSGLSPWKPRKYAAINQFVPTCQQEELLLVLLVSEALAVRDAVLSQSAEFSAARDHSLRQATAVMDLLALPAVRHAQLCLLLESLERAMKFSFASAHVWRLRALGTAAAAGSRVPEPCAMPAAAGHSAVPAVPAAGHSASRAAAVARHALRLAPDDVPLRLVAANTYYRMGWVKEGIKLASEALRIASNTDSPLQARACLLAGIGHQLQAQRARSRAARAAASAECARLLQRAAQLDSNDHLAFCHLALLHASQGMLNEAMEATRGCLAARADCGAGLRLAAALWSCACAGRRGLRALQAARLARAQYPAARWPLAALAQLQLVWESGEAALATGKELLALVTGSDLDDSEIRGYMQLDASDTDTRSTLSYKASLAAESAGGGARDGALSDVGSATGASVRALALHDSWLALAEICLRLGRVAAAAGCVGEAAALQPASHQVLYTRGLVEAASGECEAALSSFRNALAVNPRHIDSMLQLGATYYALGWLRLAEKALRDACALAPRRAEPWRQLALVLHALGEPSAAADAAAAALQLQPHQPALPLPTPL